MIPKENILEYKQIIEFIILRNQHEDALYLQSIRGIIKLLLGFVCLFYSIKYVKNSNYKSYLSTVFYLSLIAVTFGGLYKSTLYLYYPEPYFVLLSTIKAMFLMQLFACAGISKMIIDSNFNIFSKAIFICVLFFGSFGGQTGENLALFMFVAGVLIQISSKGNLINNFFQYSFFQNVSKLKLVFPHDSQILLMVLFVTIPLTAYTLNNKLNSYSPYHEGRFTIVNTSSKFLKEASSLEKCDDFNFLPIEKDYFLKYINTDQFQNITNPFLIHFSKKSNYLGDPAHLYLDLINQQVYFQRKRNVMNLFDENLSESVRNKAWNSLKQDQVILVAPEGLLPNYFYKKFNMISNDFIYIFPSGLEQRDKFVKECKLDKVNLVDSI